jgi:hypothetical protein
MLCERTKMDVPVMMHSFLLFSLSPISSHAETEIDAHNIHEAIEKVDTNGH